MNFDILKNSWIKNETISFSYTKKYLIHYGDQLIDEYGSFSGKLDGYGYNNGKDIFVTIQEKSKYYKIFLNNILDK